MSDGRAQLPLHYAYCTKAGHNHADADFIVDLVLNFRTAVVTNEGQLLYSQREVTLHYAKVLHSHCPTIRSVLAVETKLTALTGLAGMVYDRFRVLPAALLCRLFLCTDR